MFVINIQGIKDGNYEIDEVVSTKEIQDIFPEFFDDIKFKAKLVKVANRYSVEGNAVCKAKLICDRTLKEYDEEVTASVKVNFLADTSLYLLKKENASGDDYTDDDEIVISEDTVDLDLTAIIREELALSLPMKRISPEAKNMKFEIEKEDKSSSEEKIDPRWAALKNIKLDNK